MPVWTPIAGPRRLARLSQLNQDSLMNWCGDRLDDDAIVLGECGVHSVCVGCIRRAATPNRPLSCIAMGAECSTEYGHGLRWCFDTDEYSERHRLPDVVVRCSCGRDNQRDTYSVENTAPGGNVQQCKCMRNVCFDCGTQPTAFDCLPDGRTRPFCHECRNGGLRPLRTSVCFPQASNHMVTDKQVIDRALEILRNRGLSVVCEHCTTAVERVDGCKFVTHCGTEICSECNVRGCRSSGSVVGQCCPGSSELKVQARPHGRMALSLWKLFCTTRPESRPGALAAIAVSLRQRLP